MSRASMIENLDCVLADLISGRNHCLVCEQLGWDEDAWQAMVDLVIEVKEELES